MAKRHADKQLIKDGRDDDDGDGSDVAEGPMVEASREVMERRQIRGLPKKRALPASQPSPANGAFGAVAAPSNPFAALAPPRQTNGSQQSPSPSDSNSSAYTSLYTSMLGLNRSVVNSIEKALDKDPFVDLYAALVTISSSYKRERHTLDDRNRTLLTPPAPSESIQVKSKPASTNVPLPKTTPESSQAPRPPMAPSSFSFGGTSVKSITSQASVPSGSGFTPNFHAAPSTAEKSLFTFGKPMSPNEKQKHSATPATAIQDTKATSRPGAFNLAKGHASKQSPLRNSTSTEDVTLFGQDTKTETESQEQIKTVPESQLTSAQPSSSSLFQSDSTQTTTASTLGSKAQPVLGGSIDKPTASASLFGGSNGPPSGSLFGNATASTGMFGNTGAGSKSPFSFGSGSASPFGGGFGGFSVAQAAVASAGTLNTGGITTPPKLGNLNKVGFTFGGKPSFGGGGSAFGASEETSNPTTTNELTRIDAPTLTTRSDAPAVSVFGTQPSTATSTSGFSFPNSTTSNIVPSESGQDTVPEVVTPLQTTMVEGQGEENEETLSEYRCSLFLFISSDGPGGGGKKNWESRGVCIVKLKLDKLNQSRRLLARSDANKKINMNFRLFNDFKVGITSEKENVVAFYGFESTSLIAFRLRFKTREMALEFKRDVEQSMSILF